MKEEHPFIPDADPVERPNPVVFIIVLVLAVGILLAAMIIATIRRVNKPLPTASPNPALVSPSPSVPPTRDQAPSAGAPGAAPRGSGSSPSRGSDVNVSVDDRDSPRTDNRSTNPGQPPSQPTPRPTPAPTEEPGLFDDIGNILGGGL